MSGEEELEKRRLRTELPAMLSWLGKVVYLPLAPPRSRSGACAWAIQESNFQTSRFPSPRTIPQWNRLSCEVVSSLSLGCASRGWRVTLASYKSDRMTSKTPSKSEQL